MRVHLLRQSTLENFIYCHSDSIAPIDDWLSKIKIADWSNPGGIKKIYGSADILGKSCHRVVFNLGGNNYRMICKYSFGFKLVHLYICWMGTHAASNKLCTQGKQYTTNIY